ncbi:MAG: tRNA threonylcarbamoyladenosine dehydratase [Oscillospiraceae bacterium]|nr:tRNA threonylcarbamoyladenosine dehydratase [Oscillospiraceae bacterium]
METRYTRTEWLLGADAVEKLKNSSVLLFGVGGVGSYTAEALARAGIGRITIVDCDVVNVTNINRQIPALTSTVGKEKTAVMAERMRDIAPDAVIETVNIFVSPETIDRFDFSKYDFVIDAIDNVTAKLLIIKGCDAVSTPVISCMGTGNKLDPSRFKITDISKTQTCPLARVMRRELKKAGVNECLALWSDEEPVKLTTGERLPSSVSFVPATAGLRIAGEVILRLAEIKRS